MNRKKLFWIFRLLAGAIGFCILVLPALSLAEPELVSDPAPIRQDEPDHYPAFDFGKTIPLSIKLMNFKNAPVDLSGIPLEVIISGQDGGREIVRVIPCYTGSFVIAPLSQQTWSIAWDQKDNQGIQVKPGIYFLSMNVSGIQARGRVVILDPEGARVGSITPQSTVTSSRMTIRLESVTLNASGGFTRIRVLFPPGHSPSCPNIVLAMVFAVYRIDNGSWTDFPGHDMLTKDATENPVAGEIDMTYRTHPIPCSAKVLTISSRESDMDDANWTFSIDLDQFPACVFANGTIIQKQNVSLPATSVPASPASQSLPLSPATAVIALACSPAVVAFGKKL